MSLYQELGGDRALDAAFDVFYEKVLADDRINGYFARTDMNSLKRKGKAFLTMAFGGPNHYQGQGLRHAHATARAEGLDEADFRSSWVTSGPPWRSWVPGMTRSPRSCPSPT